MAPRAATCLRQDPTLQGASEVPSADILSTKVASVKIASAKVALVALLEALFVSLLIALSEAVTAEYRASAEEPSHARSAEEAAGVVIGAGKHVHQARPRDAPEDALGRGAAQHAARAAWRASV
jgi:hypothetical protein